MSIEAINEHLLRAIGVGVALLDIEALSLRFHNDTFAEWFGGPEKASRLAELFPGLAITELQAALERVGRYTTECDFRLRRRTMVVAMDFNLALDRGDRVAVLVCQNITRMKELESMIDSYSMMVERNAREIRREKEHVERLLLNVMPHAAYEEYRTFGVVTPRAYDPVSVLALDFVQFTEMAATLDPAVLVSELNDIYAAFDRIGEQFGCERIKSVGDIYVTVAGMPDPAERDAISVADAAVRFLRYLSQRNASHPTRWQCRIGCASGAVIGSVVGVQRYIYDVFGPAVSRAQRLRWQVAEPMSIATDAAFAGMLGERFALTPLGTHDLAGGAGPVFRLGEAVMALQAL